MNTIILAVVFLGLVSAFEVCQPSNGTFTSLFFNDLKDGHQVHLDLDFCSPCRKFFQILKAVVGDLNELTKAQLEKAMEAVCDLLGNGFGGICEKVIPQVLDTLFKIITDVEKDIDPESICKFFHAC